VFIFSFSIMSDLNKKAERSASIHHFLISFIIDVNRANDK